MPKHNTESNKEATNSPLLCTLKDGQVPGVLFPYVIGRASHSMQNNTFGTWLKRISHGAKNNSWHKFTQTRNVNFQFSGFSHFSLDISLVHLFVLKSFLLICSDLRMLVLLMLWLVCQLFSLLYYQITVRHFIGHLQNKLVQEVLLLHIKRNGVRNIWCYKFIPRCLLLGLGSPLQTGNEQILMTLADRHAKPIDNPDTVHYISQPRKVTSSALPILQCDAYMI